MGKWIGIVGESFDNEDGSSRQSEIARCEEGEIVSLVLDPLNRFDPNCVRVISERGVQIGNLSKDHAALFAPHLRAGNEIEAEIAKINGGSRDKPSLGVVIDVEVDEDDFEKSLAFVRTHKLAGERFHSTTRPTQIRANSSIWLWLIGVLFALGIVFFARS